MKKRAFRLIALLLCAVTLLPMFSACGGDSVTVITVNGENYLLETALRADVSISRAYRGDTMGNLTYHGTGTASHPIVATCGDISIVECDHLCEAGEIGVDEVRVPGMFVDMILEV